ncbi:Z1 domain-containing protein [Calidifontibacter indicus]|uniref:Z1 domain-containing protein n=1 Tax=Calidifontibacter indicus TaxID=419650 RepID=A0A3D9UMM7_9MICO|nr:Z1 domain-containing protein [Calidifontibacter indicus]REF29693.1 Z1 domain-containing protein [Calidifontibacter indicus]
MSNTILVRGSVMLKIDQYAKQNKPVTPEQIRSWVDNFADVVEGMDPGDMVDREQIAKEIEGDVNVHIGTWNSMSDDSDHIPWLHARLEDKEAWKFWDRYKRFMRDELKLPPKSITRLDEVTDEILGRLEDPKREGGWDRRGLVAGQVQSGKTGNYTGLITKAIDNGYKLIVVLAGVHNSLRSQTQARIDEGILGFDTRAIRQAQQADGANRIGVGKLAGEWLHVSSFTSSSESGDFRLNVAQAMGVVPGGSDPIILVVKKNKSILDNLYKWSTHLKGTTDPETGKFRVKNVPVLVIDDEADHASVNTKFAKDDSEIDPSEINRLIRKFLDTFEQTAYVAYTATPFANIFIDPDADHSTVGEDLFPRSFIINLPAPSTYIGPERVFGLDADNANAVEGVEALDIVRETSDYEEWLPDKHKALDQLGGELPSSLEDAIVFFLMAGAVRRLRGQAHKHHSMLIHVTRFTVMQRRVADQVAEYLANVTDRLEFGEGSSPLLAAQIDRLWHEDLLPTSLDISRREDLASQVGDIPTLDEVKAEMAEAGRQTRLHVVNGTSADALEYVDHPDGISVIAIGGDKLSRGLTLEGLCVSYYLRASRMYDTLMQMGRWFGYRPGYLDLCRLYTTSALVNWYEKITAASAELQAEFEAMSAVGSTPQQFGLRVRQLPDGLLVTSPQKLKHAATYSISFSGGISETVTFLPDQREANLKTLAELMVSLGDDHSPVGDGRVWRNVDADTVIRFLSEYKADKAALKSRPEPLVKYIKTRRAEGELGSWTVVIAGRQNGLEHWDVAGDTLSLIERSNQAGKETARYTVRRVVSPAHELVDFTAGSPGWDRALAETVAAWELRPNKKAGAKPPSLPSGRAERFRRSVNDGLLLVYPLSATSWLKTHEGECLSGEPFVGFAVSFPHSVGAKPLEYKVNPVFLKNVFGWDDDDDA